MCHPIHAFSFLGVVDFGTPFDVHQMRRPIRSHRDGHASIMRWLFLCVREGMSTAWFLFQPDAGAWIWIRLEAVQPQRCTVSFEHLPDFLLPFLPPPPHTLIKSC